MTAQQQRADILLKRGGRGGLSRVPSPSLLLQHVLHVLQCLQPACTACGLHV